MRAALHFTITWNKVSKGSDMMHVSDMIRLVLPLPYPFGVLGERDVKEYMYLDAAAFGRWLWDRLRTQERMWVMQVFRSMNIPIDSQCLVNRDAVAEAINTYMCKIQKTDVQVCHFNPILPLTLSSYCFYSASACLYISSDEEVMAVHG